MTLDQIAANRRQRLERAHALTDNASRAAAPEVGEKFRPGVFAGAEKDRIGVRRGFVRQRRHMQAAKRDVGAFRPVVIGQAIRAVGRGDVDLNHDQIGLVVQVERFDVLVLNLDVIVVGPR